jgi:hypothetical protein
MVAEPRRAQFLHHDVVRVNRNTNHDAASFSLFLE